MTRRSELSDWFEHGIDAASRTLYLGGGIDADSSERTVKGLHLLDRTSGDIFLKLTSWGGEWAEGLAIFDAIKTCQNQVTITTYGIAGSMAGVIFQAADIRRMTPNASLMVHYGTESLDDHALNITRQAAWNEKQCRLMEDIFLSRIQEKAPMSRTQFRRRFSFDVFLTAEEALSLGLADEIWGAE